MFSINNPPTTDIPATILIPDILFLVFGHLTRHDLSRCLRVSHQSHDIAGQLLYGSKLGVEYGKAWSFSIYAPVQSSAEPTSTIPSDPHTSLSEDYDDFQHSFSPPSLTCVLSPTKTNLLGRVRHLTYHLKSPNYYHFHYPAPSNIFPSVHTLTFQYRRGTDLFGHSASFLPHLRPRHIRLTRIPELEHPFSLYLDTVTGVGSRVEKVTLQFNQSTRNGVWCGTRARLLPCIGWPACMRQLDLVCTIVEGKTISRVRSVVSADIGSTRQAVTGWDSHEQEMWSSPSNEWLIGPSNSWNGRDKDQRGDCTALISIAKVAASASFATGARVVGLEDENQVRDNMAVDGEDGQAGIGPRQADVLGDLREAYVSTLKEAGLAAEEARRRADDLELISLDEYWRESGNVAF